MFIFGAGARIVEAVAIAVLGATINKAIDLGIEELKERRKVKEKDNGSDNETT
tara:strand:- start:169 stop:327 length:159 start_codon:yes stop_codon:yes gene_type:complete